LAAPEVPDLRIDASAAKSPYEHGVDIQTGVFYALMDQIPGE
jgi:hypothetical protein